MAAAPFADAIPTEAPSDSPVAAETLRVLRDETARRDDFDENEETSVGSETSETSRRRDADVETHRCVALRGLRLAKYPRLDTLETNQESNDTFDRESFELASPSSSRAILVALAWAAADLDVFALAHADRSARDLGASGLGVPNFGDDTELTTDKRNESFLLPPYGSDAAASPASATPPPPARCWSSASSSSSEEEVSMTL